jgi:hypothetical protein
MKYTLRKIFDAWVAIQNTQREKGTKTWAYLITKNKSILFPDVSGIGEAKKPFDELEKQRQEYCRNRAEKDKRGKPIIENGVYKGIANNDPEIARFVEELTILDDEFNKFLDNGETELNLYMIDFKEVPEKISPLDFENLSIMISSPVEAEKRPAEVNTNRP